MEQLQEVAIQLKRIDNRTVVLVKAKSTLLSQIKPRIEDFFASSVVDEVRLFAGLSLSIDANLSRDLWHGINLIVLANEINVNSPAIWDVSGKDNDHVYTSNAGTNPDGTGKDGNDGFPGESGGNVLVMSNTIENPERLTIVSNGGNGSNGQDGGDGKDGADGGGISKDALEKKFPPCAQFIGKTRGKEAFKIMRNMKRSMENVKNEWLLTNTGIACTMDIERKEFNDEVFHVYLDVETHEGNQIIFSLYFTFLTAQSFLLYKGSPGQPGKPGGKCGLGGQGGFPGQITCKRLDDGGTLNIKTRNRLGIDGDDGDGGFNGTTGKNGWDMGYVDGFGQSPTFYGQDEKSKLKISYDNRNSSNRVFCPYKALDTSKAYAEIEESTEEFQLLGTTKERNISRPQSDRQHHSKAVNKRTITKISIFSGFYEYLHQMEQEWLQLERQHFEEDKACQLMHLEIKQEQISKALEQNAKENQRLKEEKNTKNQCLEQQRLAKEKLHLEQVKTARERNRLEQLRIVKERQRLDQERIAREKQLFEQLRSTQEKQQIKQAAERQQLEEDVTTRENKLLQQMKDARDRERVALNQTQTELQRLQQLEIDEEIQRLAQEQIKIKIEKKKQQIAEEKQQAELRQIEKENLKVQKQIEEEEERLKQQQIKEEEHRLAQQLVEDELQRLALTRIEDEQQRIIEQQNPEQVQE